MNPKENITGRTRGGPNPDFLIVVREHCSTNALMRLRYRIKCDSCNMKQPNKKYIYVVTFAMVGLYTSYNQEYSPLPPASET